MTPLGLLRLPGTVLFGAGVASEVGRLAAAHGRRALVCTDPAIASSPHLGRVTGALAAHGLEVRVLDAAVPELPVDSVEAAIAEARRVEPDCVVGVGGGSCLDLAKAVALGLTVERPIADFYGEHAVPAPVRPLIAVPTTAGTGSEVTPVAVLSDPTLALKVGIASPHLVPRAAVCDPELTHGAPPGVTAHAGIDALAHAVESFTARRAAGWPDASDRIFVGKNVLSDRFALHAARLVARHLPGALADAPASRAAMLEASLCAGIAFATAGNAAAHALQYPLGARTKTPHGLGTGLLLPYVMDFNRDAVAAELAEVADALGCREPSAGAAVDAVCRLCAAIGLPGSLAELGVARDELPAMAALGVAVRRLIVNNPRPVTEADALEILTRAWRGELAAS